MKRLVRLYPRGWRDRYGDELHEFLARRGAGLGTTLDLIRGAIDAHLHPELITHRAFSAVAPGGTPADELVFVPRIGFRSVHALGTRANVVARQDGRTLTAAITPDRDGVRLQFTVIGIPMDLGPAGKRFEGPVRIHDDHGRDISKPRPRWTVGGSFSPAADGTTMLHYTTLLEPLARDVRSVELGLSGDAGEWTVLIPVEPEGFTGARALSIDAADTKHGITVAARMVARSETGTAIELEAYFDPPLPVDDPRPAKRWIKGIGTSSAGEFMHRGLALRDDTGHHYKEQGGSFGDAVARKHREVVTFPVVDIDAATLEIPDLWTAEFNNEFVTLPVPGELDVTIAECAARVVATRDAAGSIRIDFAPSDPDADRQLLYLEGVVIPGGDPRGTIGMSITHCYGQQPYVNVPDPTAKVDQVTLGSPVVKLRGPWTLRIPLPRA